MLLHDQKLLRGGKDSFGFTIPGYSPPLREGIEGWNLMADLSAVPCSITSNRNQRKDSRDHGLLTALYLASLLMKLSTTCLGNDVAHSGLDPPTAINHQDSSGPQVSRI